MNASWGMMACPPTPYLHHAVEIYNENIGGTNYAGTLSQPVKATIVPFGSGTHHRLSHLASVILPTFFDGFLNEAWWRVTLKKRPPFSSLEQMR